jgi:crotonobetainyl-CoA:carnitine CoA-transferase CaiB-like acyl-CoA transferase
MLPLADVRVIAVEQFGAGPWGTMQLADLGADVIKIEDPSVGGDVARFVPPYQEHGSSLFFESFNRRKRSITLDLRHPDARKVFERLVRHADAVFSNLRGDQPAKLGIRYVDLAHVNPRVVCVSLSGFGTTGPRAAEGAYDATIQALAGWMSVTGGPAEPPTKSGLSLVDFAAGYVAAIALIAGIWQARRDGRGTDVDLSLFETALALLTYMGTWTASRQWTAQRVPDSAHQTIVPFQTFRSADGWLVVACAKEALWRKLCEALELPELAADPRFADFAARGANRKALVEILNEVFVARRVADWMDVLSRHGVPCAPVNDIQGALSDEQALARETLTDYAHPILGGVQMVTSALGRTLTEGATERGPLLGEHTSDVLTGICGFTADEIGTLAQAGAFGPPARGGAA